MEIPRSDIEASTKIIATNLQRRNPLEASMRSGLVRLAGALAKDIDTLKRLDSTEQGLYVIDAHSLLAEGWLRVVGNLDHEGRDFKRASGAEDIARMHYRLSWSQVDEQWSTGEDQQRALTDSAFMLGQLVIRSTVPK